MKSGTCLKIVQWELSDESLSSLSFSIYFKVSIIDSLYIYVSSSEWIRNGPTGNLTQTEFSLKCQVMLCFKSN